MMTIERYTAGTGVRVTGDTPADLARDLARRHPEVADRFGLDARLIAMGEVIRYDRQRQGKSQTQFAALAGVTQAQLSLIERGSANNRPKISTFMRLFGILSETARVEVADYFVGSGQGRLTKTPEVMDLDRLVDWTGLPKMKWFPMIKGAVLGVADLSPVSEWTDMALWKPSVGVRLQPGTGTLARFEEPVTITAYKLDSGGRILDLSEGDIVAVKGTSYSGVQAGNMLPETVHTRRFRIGAGQAVQIKVEGEDALDVLAMPASPAER